MSRGPEERREALHRGAEAEARVAETLEARGYRTLARNWRGGGGELDLVVARGGELRMVEVKLREPDDPAGWEAIDAHKRRCLVRAAEAFLQAYEDIVDEVSFTVALVEGEEIQWIENAFDATGR